MLGAGIFMLTLCCGLLVWGTGKYLKTDWTPDFQKLKSTNNGSQLTAEMRDELMDGLSKMQQGQGSSQTFNQKHTKWDIPKGAIMAFNLSSCPEWWSRFAEADGRFIMGSNSNIKGKGGKSEINITISQLPPHYFYITHGSKWNSWLDENPERTVAWMWDWTAKLGHSTRKDTYYYLLWAEQWKVANAGRTNTVWNGQSINIQNPYIKLLYCQKN